VGRRHVWKVGGKVFAIGGWNDVGQLFVTSNVPISPMTAERSRRAFGRTLLASRGMKWIQRQTSQSMDDAALKDYLRESHRLVVLKLTKQARKELTLCAVPSTGWDRAPSSLFEQCQFQKPDTLSGSCSEHWRSDVESQPISLQKTEGFQWLMRDALRRSHATVYWKADRLPSFVGVAVGALAAPNSGPSDRFSSSPNMLGSNRWCRQTFARRSN